MITAQGLLILSEKERADFFASLTDEEALQLAYKWEFWARQSQVPPETFSSGEKDVWLMLCGRGFGKTRTGGEQCRSWIEEWQQMTERGEVAEIMRLALVAETAGDARDVLVEGPAGLMAICPPWGKPDYQPSKRRLTWFDGNNQARRTSNPSLRPIAYGFTYAGKEPDQLRGPQFHKFWSDELAKYQYPEETWSNLDFGVRMNPNPQGVVTTTPRPIPLIRRLLQDPKVVVTTGSSYENILNLSPKYIEKIIRKYEGTRLGKQELHAQILERSGDAIFSQENFDRNRVPPSQISLSMMDRFVIAVDPSAASNVGEDESAEYVYDETEGKTAECGITLVGEREGHGFLFDDRSDMYSPGQWGAKIARLYHDTHAECVVAEKNNGGAMVAQVIHGFDPAIPVRLVWASKGKAIRAAPVASLYEQHKVHHVGQFAIIEDQLLCFGTDKYWGPGSPDRAESAIWGLHYLLVKGGYIEEDSSKFATVKY